MAQELFRPQGLEGTSMRKSAVRLVVGLLVALGAVGALFVLGMRRRSPFVVNAVRGLGRATRPLAMKSAGSPGVHASVIRHVGRRTGRPYETPVVAVATADGFAIALPYGRSTDWLKNVLASGSAVIVREGDAYEVDQPEIVGLETVDDRFAPADRRAHRTFGVAECVRMRRVERPFGSVEQRAAPAEQ